MVAWQALPAVFPSQGKNIGGLETAAWQFAVGLARQSDWHVQFVVRSPTKRRRCVVDGVELIPVTDRWLAMRRQVSQCIDVPARRITRWRPRLLWQIPLLACSWPLRPRDVTGFQPDPRLRAIDSDVWVAWGVSRESAAVISTAQATAKPAVLMIRSAADLSAAFAGDEADTTSPYGEPPEACRHAITQASTIVCQAAYQQRLLEQRFGRSGELIRNGIDLQVWQPQDRSTDEVLWVGRYETFHKRIDQAIAIARTCPDIPFRLIANASDANTEAAVRADLPANVTLTDYVPHDQMPAMFAAARVFLSTGSAAYEGFPNVLLQAAATATPIVSLEDFDDFIVRSQSGIVCGPNGQAAAAAIQQFWNRTRTLDAAHVRDYLQQHHDRPRVIDQLACLLAGVVEPEDFAHSAGR